MNITGSTKAALATGLTIALTLACLPQAGAAELRPSEPFNKKVERLLAGDNASVNLNAMPELPNLPHYTGRARFERGAAFPYTPGGATILVEFNVQEEQAMVMNWYQAVLRQQRWHIDASTCPTMVSGMDEKRNRAIIVLRDGTLTGYRTHVMIQFKQKV